MVITRQPSTFEQLRGKTIAIPGRLTTAFLALQLAMGKEGEAFHAVESNLPHGRVPTGVQLGWMAECNPRFAGPEYTDV